MCAMVVIFLVLPPVGLFEVLDSFISCENAAGTNIPWRSHSRIGFWREARGTW